MKSKNILFSFAFAMAGFSQVKAELPAKVPNVKMMDDYVKEAMQFKSGGTVEQKQSFIRRATNFLVENKGCLTGTGCAPFVSLSMNYLLGAVVGTVIQISTANLVSTGSKIAEKPIRKIGNPTTQRILAFGAILAIVSSLIGGTALADLVAMSQYQKTMETGQMPVGMKAKVRCLFGGKYCSMAVRRALAFNQGIIHGSIGGGIVVIAIKDRIERYRKKLLRI